MVINMQVKPQMKIYPLIRDTCMKNKIVIEKMLTNVANETNRIRHRINYQYRGYYPLEREVAEAFSKYTGITVEDLLKASVERIDDVELSEKELKHVIPDWIIGNLECYGNTVIPNNLIESCGGVKQFVEQLEYESGKSINIVATRYSYDGTIVPLESAFRKRSYTIGYIAEVVQNRSKEKNGTKKRKRQRKPPTTL